MWICSACSISALYWANLGNIIACSSCFFFLSSVSLFLSLSIQKSAQENYKIQNTSTVKEYSYVMILDKKHTHCERRIKLKIYSSEFQQRRKKCVCLCVFFNIMWWIWLIPVTLSLQFPANWPEKIAIFLLPDDFCLIYSQCVVCTCTCLMGNFDAAFQINLGEFVFYSNMIFSNRIGAKIDISNTLCATFTQSTVIKNYKK